MAIVDKDKDKDKDNDTGKGKSKGKSKGKETGTGTGTGTGKGKGTETGKGKDTDMGTSLTSHFSDTVALVRGTGAQKSAQKAADSGALAFADNAIEDSRLTRARAMFRSGSQAGSEPRWWEGAPGATATATATATTTATARQLGADGADGVAVVDDANAQLPMCDFPFFPPASLAVALQQRGGEMGPV